jgi:hypothetical protein
MHGRLAMTGATDAFALTVVAALLLASYLLGRDRKPAEMKCAVARPVALSVTIICGDCAGDNWMPVVTVLNPRGQCARCGGRSWVLRSQVAVGAAVARVTRMRLIGGDR